MENKADTPSEHEIAFAKEKFGLALRMDNNPPLLTTRIKKGDRYNLFLDDVRNPKKVVWVCLPHDLPMKVVRNYAEFVGMIEACGLPEFISFDHDLADEHYTIGGVNGFSTFDYKLAKEKTGMCCAKWLVEYCLDNNLDLPKWLTHSLNPCGCDNINGLLNGFKKFQDDVKAGKARPII